MMFIVPVTISWDVFFKLLDIPNIVNIFKLKISSQNKINMIIP